MYSIVLALAGLLVVSGITTQYRADLSRSLRFHALAAVDFSAQTLGVAVAIIAAVLGADYWAIVAQQITFVVVTCALSVAFSRWRPGLPSRHTSVRRFVRFGTSVLGTQMLGYATNNIDNVTIGAVWGPGPLGRYSRAYQLLMVPINQISDPTSRVILPILSRVHDDPPTYQRYVEKAQHVGTYALAPAFSIAAGLAAPLVAVLFGPQVARRGPDLRRPRAGRGVPRSRPGHLSRLPLQRKRRPAVQDVPHHPAADDGHDRGRPALGAGRRGHRPLAGVRALLGDLTRSISAA